jgi:hypothetical protein
MRPLFAHFELTARICASYDEVSYFSLNKNIFIALLICKASHLYYYTKIAFYLFFLNYPMRQEWARAEYEQKTTRKIPVIVLERVD